MRYFFYIIIFTVLNSTAQTIEGVGGVVLRTTEPVDRFRYEDIHGDPYLFSEFVPATLYKTNKEYIKNLPMNFNGYSGMFEYQANGRIYELDNEFFVKIEIQSDKYLEEYAPYMSDSIVFIKGLNPQDYMKFYIMLEGGFNATVFKEFKTFVSERKIENVGKTIEVNNFSSVFLYYLVTGQEPESLKLKKRPILRALNSKEVDDFVRENELELESEDELIQLLQYYNSIDYY